MKLFGTIVVSAATALGIVKLNEKYSEEITEKCKTLGDGIVDTFNNLIKGTKHKVEDIKEDVVEKAEEVKEAASEIFNKDK